MEPQNKVNERCAYQLYPGMVVLDMHDTHLIGGKKLSFGKNNQSASTGARQNN